MQPAAADEPWWREDVRTEDCTPVLCTARELHETRDATSTSAWEESGLVSFHGLRGVLALWVALGHLFSGTPWQINLANQFAMPFFFILSGCAPAPLHASVRDEGASYDALCPTCRQLTPQL